MRLRTLWFRALGLGLDAAVHPVIQELGLIAASAERH
jgi:hypothetical protein